MRCILTLTFACAMQFMFADLAIASDHKDSPYTRANPEADIGDAFLFLGDQTGGLVMAFTLNPLSGSGMDGTNPTSEIKLDQELTYIFKLDTDNDLRADLAYKIKATDVPGETQKQEIAIRRASGAEAVSNLWNGTSVGTGSSTVLNGPLEVIEGKAGELLFVGPRRDPFFFDWESVEAPTALAIRQALSGGDDLPAAGSSEGAFGRTDMTLITLEVPTLGKDALNFWVIVADENGTAVDRMGRAGTQGIFFVDPPKGYNPEYYLPRNKAKYADIGQFNDAYNASVPADDFVNYSEQLTYRLRQLEVSQADIAAKVAWYLPDVLQWDPTKAPGYPNGRNFREDAIYWIIEDINPFLDANDVALPLVSTQRLSDRFPYAAPAVVQAFKPGSLLVPVNPIYME